MPNKIIRYRRDLKMRARALRKNLTPAEALLWEAIRKKKLGIEFHRQVPMLDYIVDFYCHEIGLAIEVDGEVHDHNVLEDGRRQARLESEGVQFLRFSNSQVTENLTLVIEEINRKIEEALG
ncbi:endonuclease domain-containing protein [Flavobacteriaceae bacterium TK19130]|nr:endonuclease domain-containing protein [Thermobacterium salinum]